jgi:hypothetical protein
MNLYGRSLKSFIKVLGSKNSEMLTAASTHISECYDGEPELAKKGEAWLRTLINTGLPLRQDRKQPSEPADGGLMIMRMETNLHANAIHSIVHALVRDDYLDLADESSTYAHPSVRALWDDLTYCGFSHSDDCPWQIHKWMDYLGRGTPLFGDGFWSNWCYYTIFTNKDLAAMIPVFHAAAKFRRRLPRTVPTHIRKKVQVTLSEGGKAFIADLIRWFSQIEKAGQDAFIMWS